MHAAYTLQRYKHLHPHKERIHGIWDENRHLSFVFFLLRTCSIKFKFYFCAIARKRKPVDLQRDILHSSVLSCGNNYGCYTTSAFALHSQPPATRRVRASLRVVFAFQGIWGLVCSAKLLSVFIQYLKCGIDVTFCSGRLRLFFFFLVSSSTCHCKVPLAPF